MPIEDMSQKKLLISEFLLALREKQFSNHEFSINILISDIKYRHPGSKHKNKFHSFNDQLNYTLFYYFIKSKNTKSNINKFLTNPYMAPFIKKLFYKNVDKWMEKLLKIPRSISEDKQTEYKFNIESNISKIIK